MTGRFVTDQNNVNNCSRSCVAHMPSDALTKGSIDRNVCISVEYRSRFSVLTDSSERKVSKQQTDDRSPISE